MQAEKRGVDTDSSRTEVNDPPLMNKSHISGRETSGNSYESHGESGNKPAGNTIHQGHPEDQTVRTKEKSLDHGQHEEMGLGSPEQHEEMKQAEMKHGQHGEMEHEGHEPHAEMRHEGTEHEGHGAAGGKGHGNHHAHMLEDFRKRFIVSLVLTFPVLLLSSTIQDFFNFELRVQGSDYLSFLFSSVIYFYGGYPFLRGIKEELSEKSPGMMTLIAIAISVAYFYSSAVVFGLHGDFLFPNRPCFSQ